MINMFFFTSIFSVNLLASQNTLLFLTFYPEKIQFILIYAWSTVIVLHCLKSSIQQGVEVLNICLFLISAEAEEDFFCWHLISD